MMALLVTHHAAVQPIVRSRGVSVVYEGAITATVESQEMTATIEQPEMTATIENPGELEATTA